MMLGKDNIERLPSPVGTSDWATFSRDSYCVDKTLLIKELIDSRSRVVLFTRPRRLRRTSGLPIASGLMNETSGYEPFRNETVRSSLLIAKQIL